jgi:FtsH-binding integral membrane protein
MFIGHFGIGFGSKAAARRVSLGTLFLAAQFLDLIWPTFLLLGIERVEIKPGITKATPLDFVSYPISHSLFVVCIWGLLFGVAYWLLRKDARSALVLGICVVSHWILDLIVHRPDLPLYPGDSPKFGFGLWNSPLLTLALEAVIFAGGLFLYVNVTKPINRVGSYALWGLVAFLIAIHVVNIFGPPPPNTTAIAWAGQLQWLLVFWAYWADRNRSSSAFHSRVIPL